MWPSSGLEVAFGCILFDEYCTVCVTVCVTECREKEKTERKDRKVLEILQAKDARINQLETVSHNCYLFLFYRL